MVLQLALPKREPSADEKLAFRGMRARGLASSRGLGLGFASGLLGSASGRLFALAFGRTWQAFGSHLGPSELSVARLKRSSKASRCALGSRSQLAHAKRSAPQLSFSEMLSLGEGLGLLTAAQKAFRSCH